MDVHDDTCRLNARSINSKIGTSPRDWKSNGIRGKTEAGMADLCYSGIRTSLKVLKF